MPSYRNMSKLIECLTLFWFCSSLLIPSGTAADAIAANQTISDGETIVSAGGNFELGFISPGSSKSRFLGIWYKKISTPTIIWIANRETPIDTISGLLKLDSMGNLVLFSGSTSIIWSSNSSRSGRWNPVAQLLDTGNLVIRDESTENFFWQSFDYPGNTLMPGAKLGRDLVTGLERSVSSWRSDDDPSPGNYKFQLDISGYPQLFLRKNSTESFRFGPWNGVRFSGMPSFGPNPIYHNEFVLNEQEIYYKYELINSSASMRITMDPGGRAQRFTWINRTQDWQLYLTYQADDCDRYALCGPYGSCDVNRSPPCECLKGFEPKFAQAWENADWTGGCVRNTQLSCGNGDSFVKYSEMKLPDTRHSWFNVSMNLEECNDMCLKNCSCTAYTNTDIRGRGSGCLLWFDDLIDIGKQKENPQEVYVRMPASENDNFIHVKSNSRVKRLVVIIVIPTLLVITALLGLCLFYVLKYRKQKTEGRTRLNVVNIGANENNREDLALFDFRTIAKATNNFSSNYKLGEGGFGPVYKGVLDGGQEIAVKRLSESSRQGLQEFKNEVSCIAKLQHRSLVRLLGCSTAEGERMLIYEYMPNRSLDFFIFDKEQRKLLDWPKRYNIINGIARGLLYLHHDSRLRIIHRDLKASNILLDYEMNAKISDFGMARSFGGSETEANTTKVVGTYGYMSPEYAIDGLFSIKSDVYSFGVLVLEIVSGKRNRDFYHSSQLLYLSGHAWRLYIEGKFWELIDEAIVESSDHHSEILRTIQIGLLCLQEHAEDRPNMSAVVLMLSSEIELHQPKKPGFFAHRKSHESDSREMFDSNHLSITYVSPRL